MYISNKKANAGSDSLSSPKQFLHLTGKRIFKKLKQNTNICQVRADVPDTWVKAIY